MTENEIAEIVVDEAVKLHIEVGPGLLESAYEILLTRLLEKRGLSVERQVIVPVRALDEYIEAGFRADMIVEKKVILELKSVDSLLPVHKKQLLTYLRFSGLHLGILLNFNNYSMTGNIKRVAN